VYVDVVGSELKHISGKNALEVLVYGPEGSEFHKKFCCWVVGVLAPTPKPTLATLHVSLFLYITNSAASDVLAAETKP
jgi:hypothetical protein